MIKVIIIESESGWGQKIDEVKEFKTLKEAEDFVKKHNSVNNKDKIPGIYWRAEIDRSSIETHLKEMEK